MDAVMYLKEKNRMCDSYEIKDFCDHCPLAEGNNGTDLDCIDLQYEHPEKAVGIVEKWSKDNPRKTYKDDFLEKFPNALVTDMGQPLACVKHIGYIKKCICEAPDYPGCLDCWNTPMEE